MTDPQKTLVLIKPDAVRRGLVGEILRRYEAKGLSIDALEMRTIDAAFADRHYAEHVEKPWYPPLRAFVTSGPLVALVLSGVPIHADAAGLLLAVTSGALMSGGAYLLWYSILPRLSPTTASTLQLSVPCLAALGGLILMGETLDTRMLVAIALTLSGIGLVIAADRRGRGFTP